MEVVHVSSKHIKNVPKIYNNVILASGWVHKRDHIFWLAPAPGAWVGAGSQMVVFFHFARERYRLTAKWGRYSKLKRWLESQAPRQLFSSEAALHKCNIPELSNFLASQQEHKDPAKYQMIKDLLSLIQHIYIWRQMMGPKSISFSHKVNKTDCWYMNLHDGRPVKRLLHYCAEFLEYRHDVCVSLPELSAKSPVHVGLPDTQARQKIKMQILYFLKIYRKYPKITNTCWAPNKNGEG